MRVDFYELVGGQGEKIVQKRTASFYLRAGKIVAEPDAPWIQKILAEPLYDPKANRCYNAKENPEDFLRHLHRQYTSAYLRATKPIEDGEGRTGEATE